MSIATQPGYGAHREPANKGRTYPAEILSPDEMNALIKASSGRAPSGVRNRALLAVLYRGGLRITEALSLYPKDIDADAGTVTVLHGKGDKRRTVGLDAGTLALVARWVDTRAERGINGRSRLFCTLAGEEIKSSYIRTLLPRLAARAGIEKRVHAHGLRHSLAFELMMEGTPVPIIQMQLGHSSLSTTEKYLSHLAPKDVIDVAHQRDEWLT